MISGWAELEIERRTMRSTGNFKEFYRSFSNRIASLAKTHTLLTDDHWQTASLREIALSELKPFAESRTLVR